MLTGAYLLSVPAVGQAGDLSKKLADSYREVDALKADIVQKTSSSSFGEVVQRMTLEMERPGRVRWGFEDGRLVVMDGSYVWHYTPSLNQAIRMPQDTQSKSAMTLLQSLDKVDEVFDVTELPVAEGADERGLALAPKGAQGAVSMRLFVAKDYGLLRIEIEDAFETRTEMTFSSVERLKDLPDERFTFTPPEGVEVVDGLMGGL
jgi:outer membrane lipoprotein carrier protein